MKRLPLINTLRLCTLSTLAIFYGCATKAETHGDLQHTQQQIKQAKQATVVLQKQLGDRLKTAVGEGGLEKGVEVCSQEAPRIAESISAEFGKTVGRTALRTRNSNNAPSEKQIAVMQSFQRDLENNQPPSEIEHFSTLENGDRLYMRPIVMQAQCLACHGDVNEELLGKLKRAYPDDQATGFSVGQLRGAFTVIW
ncbi:MAG TPA: DUF3365 domain-containing protein [Marinagarivorans sp.]